MEQPPLPEQRASDRDRERVAERLRFAAGDGQITFDELDERLNAAYAARTRADLVPLTADLQLSDQHDEEGGAREVKRTFSVRRGEGGARWLVAIMGGVERKGRWRLSERCHVINFMGGSDLDLNEVELASDRVELTVWSIMGGADIYVPEGMRVEVSDFAFMGGNEVNIEEPRPSPATPALRLRLYSLMGGADVKRGRKLTRAQRKELKRRRQREEFERSRGGQLPS